MELASKLLTPFNIALATGALTIVTSSLRQLQGPVLPVVFPESDLLRAATLRQLQGSLGSIVAGAVYVLFMLALFGFLVGVAPLVAALPQFTERVIGFSDYGIDFADPQFPLFIALGLVGASSIPWLNWLEARVRDSALMFIGVPDNVQSARHAVRQNLDLQRRDETHGGRSSIDANTPPTDLAHLQEDVEFLRRAIYQEAIWPGKSLAAMFPGIHGALRVKAEAWGRVEAGPATPQAKGSGGGESPAADDERRAELEALLDELASYFVMLAANTAPDHRRNLRAHRHWEKLGALIEAVDRCVNHRHRVGLIPVALLLLLLPAGAAAALVAGKGWTGSGIYAAGTVVIFGFATILPLAGWSFARRHLMQGDGAREAGRARNELLITGVIAFFAGWLSAVPALWAVGLLGQHAQTGDIARAADCAMREASWINTMVFSLLGGIHGLVVVTWLQLGHAARDSLVTRPIVVGAAFSAVYILAIALGEEANGCGSRFLPSPVWFGILLLWVGGAAHGALLQWLASTFSPRASRGGAGSGGGATFVAAAAAGIILLAPGPAWAEICTLGALDKGRSAKALRDRVPVRIGVRQDAPPFSFDAYREGRGAAGRPDGGQDRTARHRGFMVDICRAVLRDEGLESCVVPVDTGDRYKRLGPPMGLASPEPEVDILCDPSTITMGRLYQHEPRTGEQLEPPLIAFSTPVFVATLGRIDRSIEGAEEAEARAAEVAQPPPNHGPAWIGAVSRWLMKDVARVAAPDAEDPCPALSASHGEVETLYRDLRWPVGVVKDTTSEWRLRGELKECLLRTDQPSGTQQAQAFPQSLMVTFESYDDLIQGFCDGAPAKGADAAEAAERRPGSIIGDRDILINKIEAYRSKGGSSCQYTVTSASASIEPYGFAMRANDWELRARVDRGIYRLMSLDVHDPQRLGASREIWQIYSRYFDRPNERPSDTLSALYAIGWLPVDWRPKGEGEADGEKLIANLPPKQED